jgi:type I pantothenate kinase
LSDAEAVDTATSIWRRINLVNLRDNILPPRQRADLILKKVESHLVEEVALRRLRTGWLTPRGATSSTSTR